MHHYGEQFVKAHVDKSKSVFNITLTNHVTGAQLSLTGPLNGVFETEEKVMDQAAAEELGRKMAHFLRDNLTSGTAVMA
jgi:hypothetical protein